MGKTPRADGLERNRDGYLRLDRLFRPAICLPQRSAWRRVNTWLSMRWYHA